VLILWWECVTLHEVCGIYVVCAWFDHVYVLCSWEGIFCGKMLHVDHVYVTCWYVPIYLVGDACAQIVAILLVFVSILECYSVVCIFEKHMLAFVDLIHGLPRRGRKVPNSCFQGEFCIDGRKMHLFRGSLHSCFWELFFTWILVVLFCRWCRAFLPHLE
jgi:hypothetical protein